MYIPKRYGESKIDPCPFCGRQAIARNRQKIPVCNAHKDSVLDDLKCACGNYLETKVGKFGLYFTCPKCGNVTLKRALEMNPPKSRSAAQPEAGQPHKSGSAGLDPPPDRDARPKPREIQVDPYDPRYFG